MDLDLGGARVIITAAGSGIGAATARRFADLGASVWVCDLDPAALDSVRSPGRIDGMVADVGDSTAVDAFVRAGLETLGGIDVLINNAGVAGPAGFAHELDAEDITRTFDLNVTSMFRTLHLVVPAMIEQRSGLIVNISSTAGQYGFAHRSPYTASKWAVIGLTKTLAVELGAHGIRANAVCPGSVAGPRMDHVIELEAEASGRSTAEVRAGFERQVSMRTFVDADDIAATIAYLASPLARFVSGQVIAVDGNTETMRS